MSTITLTTVLKDNVSPGLDKIKNKGKQTGDQVSQSFDKGNKSMSNMKKTGDSLLGSFTKIAGVLGVGFGFEKVLSLGMAQSDQMTKLTIAMDMNTKSAKEVYETIDDISTKTGADQNALVDGYKKLRLQGLKPTMKELKGMTNLALANNMQFSDMVELMTNMEAGGPGRGMKKMGIQVEDLGDKMKLTYKGVTTTVKNSTKDILKYLSDMGMKGPDIIEMMGDSQAGKMRRIYDKIEEIFERLFVKMEPFIDRFTTWFENVDMGKLVDNIILIGKAFATYKIAEGFISIATSISDISGLISKGGWGALLRFFGGPIGLAVTAATAATAAKIATGSDKAYTSMTLQQQASINSGGFGMTGGLPMYVPSPGGKRKTGTLQNKNFDFNNLVGNLTGINKPIEYFGDKFVTTGSVVSASSKTTNPTTLSTERSIKNITINIDKQIGVENYNTTNSLMMNKPELERIMTEILNKSIEDASIISK